MIRSPRLVALWLVCLSTILTLVYSIGLSGPFLFDDFPNLVANDWLTFRRNTLIDWRSAALSSEAGMLRRPLAMLSFVVQSFFTGELGATASKSLNLFIHVLCSVVLFLLVSKLVAAPHWPLSSRERRLLPILATAIWALSPLHVSTVLYPVQRMAQMSALFMLAGLLVYATYRLRWVQKNPTVDGLLACTLWLLLSLIAGLLSKENAILLLPLLAAVEFFLFRGYVGGSYMRPLGRVAWVLLAAPFFAFAVFCLSGAEWIAAGYGMRDFSLSERVLTQLRILWSYNFWFALPNPAALGMFHDDISLSKNLTQPISTSIALFAWVAVLALGFLLRKAWPVLGFSVCFYLLAHSMESSVLALELVFEHRNYLPSVGVAVLLAAAMLHLVRIADLRGVSPKLYLLLPMALVFAMGVGTLSRASAWSSETSLAQAVLQHHPESARSRYFYVNTLLRSSALGRSSDEVRQDLALAYHELELLQQLDPLDISALVLLYITEVQVFPQLDKAELWFSQLEKAVSEASLTATDFAAINAFVECVEISACKIPLKEIDQLLQVFESRFWRPEALGRLRLRLANSESDVAEDAPDYPIRQNEAQATADVSRVSKTFARYSSDVELHYQLMEAQLSAADYAAVHRTAISLMQNDRARRQLPALRDIFAPAEGW